MMSDRRFEQEMADLDEALEQGEMSPREHGFAVTELEEEYNKENNDDFK